MTSKFFHSIILVLMFSVCSNAQTSTAAISIVTEEVSKEITEIVKSEKKVTTKTIRPIVKKGLQATIWPNPSNLGKVRLSVENLPEEPLFIQIFNGKDELIQEGVISGSQGASLNHTLTLPDTSGNYSIKLSDTYKVIKQLDLEIL